MGNFILGMIFGAIFGVSGLALCMIAKDEEDK